MAVVESPLFSRIRNSIGNVTYQGGRFNAIVAKSKIVNPNYPDTIGQQYARTALSWSNSQWGSISDDFRNGWELYGKSIYTRKPFSRSTLPGRHSFLAVFCLIRFLYLHFGDFSAVDFDPPTETGFLPVPTILPQPYTGAGAQGIGWKIINSSIYDIYHYFSTSDALPATRNRYNGPFEYSKSSNVFVYADTNVNLNRTLAFGSPGDSVFVKHSFVALYSPHRISYKLITRHIINTP